MSQSLCVLRPGGSRHTECSSTESKVSVTPAPPRDAGRRPAGRCDRGRFECARAAAALRRAGRARHRVVRLRKVRLRHGVLVLQSEQRLARFRIGLRADAGARFLGQLDQQRPQELDEARVSASRNSTPRWSPPASAAGPARVVVHFELMEAHGRIVYGFVGLERECHPARGICAARRAPVPRWRLQALARGCAAGAPSSTLVLERDRHYAPAARKNVLRADDALAGQSPPFASTSGRHAQSAAPAYRPRTTLPRRPSTMRR